MSKVTHSPLSALRGAASSAAASLLRNPAAVALAFALLAGLAPLDSGTRAQQAAPAKGGMHLVVEDGPAYVIYQTPEGDSTCRLAAPGEVESAGDEQLPLRQINHLRDEKQSATASTSAGLTIILRATERLEANPTAKASFIAAAAKWEAIISSQITVTIDVDYGPDFFGNTEKPYGTNTLGQTSSGGYRVSYASARQRLIGRAPAGSPEAALLGSLPATSLPTDIGSVENVFVPPSMARALGYSIDEAAAPVPRIGFNTNFTFDFDPADGTSGTDFDSVAVHEIGHALGFTSRAGARELDPASTLTATVWDFFRFRPGAGAAATFSSAPRVLSSGVDANDPHVYFGGGAELALSTGKPDGTGGDGQQSSHWKDNRLGGVQIGIMDPTIARNSRQTITENDIKAVDLFGYSLGGAAPPPPPPATPANDNFVAAQLISGSAGRATGTNVGATKEAGEPSHSPDGNTGGKSVWYNWTAPSNGTVTFDTSGSNFDTVLAAYTGSSVAALAAIAKNDDVTGGNTTSSITFNAAGGTTYRIVADGWSADEGAFELNWTHAGTVPPPNPIDGNAFFVRQQYLDFLSREPEAGEPWTGVLARCPNVFNTDPASASAGCDRVTVSSAFFRSPEFEQKGRSTLHFYRVGLGRAPAYSEFVADMLFLTRPTDAEVIQQLNAFPARFTAHADFQAALALPADQYVNTLLGRYGLQSINTPDPTNPTPSGAAKVALTRHQLIDALNAGTLNKAQVLRAVADSDQVSGAEFNRGFVTMQYFGYLRRDPEPAGLNAWLDYLNRNPADFRTMVNGFINSVEYRRRFGSQ